MSIYDIPAGTTEWTKFSATIDCPLGSTTGISVGVGIKGNTGTAYFDEIQLEEGEVANPYNLVENASFEYYNDNGARWTKSSQCTSYDGACTNGAEKTMRIYGEADRHKYIYQSLNLQGKKGDVFRLSGWARTYGLPNIGDKGTKISVLITGLDNQIKMIDMLVNPESSAWQYVSTEFITDRDYKSIDVRLYFINNVHYIYFDDIGLFKDESGNSYIYDSKGNVVGSKDQAQSNSAFEYDSKDQLIRITNPKGGKFEYTYDTNIKNRVLIATNTAEQKYSFQYNNFGQATDVKLENKNNSTPYIETKATYSTDGRYLTEIYDQQDNKVEYTYNTTTGTVATITDSKNNAGNCNYDTLDRLTEVNKTAGNVIYQNEYIYYKDKLQSIIHNDTTYNFVYDSFGNTSTISVGNQNLITNNYAARNGNLISSVYGNNQTISYQYDRFQRLTQQINTNGTVGYTYDARGNVAQIVNSLTGETINYTYDLGERLIKSVNSSGLTTQYEFDANSNVNNKKHTYSGTTSTINYTFDNDNRLTKFEEVGKHIITPTYDGLSRVTNRELKVGNTTYGTVFTYKDLGNNRTTTQLETMKNGNSDVLSYTYDSLGNIETINKGNVLQQTYYYDENSQLIREDNVDLNATIVYNYDAGGNITSKKEYAYTTSTLGAVTNTINYSYTNNNWKDQLTSYNGKAITYDQIGNPTSYNNNTYTWSNGRQLNSIQNSVTGLNTSYKYNECGIRTEKTINNVTTKYFLEGTKVIYEKTGNDTIYYSYDEIGVVGINYNGTQYYYIRNLQGDIIGILDNTLTQIVQYTYSSWRRNGCSKRYARQ